MSYYRSPAHDEATVDHSLLAVLIVAIGTVLGVVIAMNLGVTLPSPGTLIDTLGFSPAESGSQAQAGVADAAVQANADVAPAEGTASAASAPFCPPGQQPAFVLGFAELKRQVGEPMGQPLECEHANPDNGDALQQTSTGLAYYRMATNTAMFTDGWRHWALTAGGLVYWEGESPDPPPGRLDSASPADGSP